MAESKGEEEGSATELEMIAVQALLSSPHKKPRAPPEIISSPQCSLVENDRWEEFAAVGNEMIITRSGRCLFPTLRFSLSGLNPALLYSVYLDFCLVSPCKHRYRGRWISSANSPTIDQFSTDLTQTTAATLYEHPDSGHSGEYWMSHDANFSHVKLTNRPLSAAESAKGTGSLNSGIPISLKAL